MRKRKAIDLQLPFFQPLWRRIGVVAACVLWTGLELWGDNQIWAMLALCLSLYAAHQFFIAFDPQEPTEMSEEHSKQKKS